MHAEWLDQQQRRYLPRKLQLLWDSVKLMKGKYTINCCQYHDVVGCVCMLKDWISSCCVFCADYHNYFQSKLKGRGRSAVCAATQVQVCGETVELPQLHLLAAWLQYIGMVVDVPVVWCMRAAHQRVDELMALFFLGPCT